MNPKQIFLFTFILLTCSFNTWAVAPSSIHSLPEASQTKDQDQLRVEQMKKFVRFTIADYEQLKGRKMNFLERASFKLTQKRMKKMIKAYDYGDVSALQKIGWLLKGLLLGPIAVLLAYLFTTEDDRKLVKWAWIGFGGQLVLVGVILLFI